MTTNKRGELFRDPKNGKVAGVCAGVANYFGWETWLVRILIVSGVLLGMGWFIVIYIAGWFILDKKPETAGNNQSNYHSQGKAFKTASKGNQTQSEVVQESIKVKSKIWQAGEPPKQAFFDIRNKFTALEGKLRKMEQYVTSPEFTVSREINKL